MRTVCRIQTADIIANRDTALRAQGIKPDGRIKPVIVAAADQAIDLCNELASPMAIVADISIDDFAPIFTGMGRNDIPSPIEDIYRRGNRLRLFAATIGPAICDRINELFAAHEFVLGNALDAIASETTDRISQKLERSFSTDLSGGDTSGPDPAVLAYSPGYCGWHISAQKALLDELHPEEIGISLRDSFLMEPLKSISGVLIAGPKEIHAIDNSYSCCADCIDEPCRTRMETLDLDEPRQFRRQKP